MNSTRISFLCAICMLAGVMLMPAVTSAAEVVQCNFTKDLELNVFDDEVLCLQRFLNSEGFTIADSGVGSAGNETSQFGELTKAAVIRWQASNGVTPASGKFGGYSREKYLEVVASKLKSQLSSMTSGTVLGAATSAPSPVVSTPAPVVVESSSEKQARSSVSKMLSLLDDAEDQLDDAEGDIDADEYDDAKDTIDDIRDDLIKILRAYATKDFDQMKMRADDAIEDLDGVVEDIGGDEGDAQDAIDDAEEAISDAKSEINDADDDDKDVEDARDLLDDAKELLSDAEDAYDDEDYDEARDLAEEAIEKAEDAVDAIED